MWDRRRVIQPRLLLSYCTPARGSCFDRATFDWNAVATLAVFVMTLFIQRANRRDNLALHAKLDELLRVDHAARSELTQLDEQEAEVIEHHRDEEVRRSRGA
jgi:low affinity Fe/Cu permease